MNTSETTINYCTNYMYIAADNDAMKFFCFCCFIVVKQNVITSFEINLKSLQGNFSKTTPRIKIKWKQIHNFKVYCLLD